MIPFLDVGATWRELEAELLEAQRRVTHGGWYIGGPELDRFEREFADYCKADYAVGVGNGLDALKLGLEALGVGPGDEVIVPSHTFIASWLAVSQVGASPVPVEPGRDGFNMAPDRIGAAITARTRAIMPVHLYGQPADLDPILSIAGQHGLAVIEDAAQAHGSRYKGQRIGAHGDLVAWSFYPGKNLGAFGDGGAVTTNNPDLARAIRMMGNYGSLEKYDHRVMGTNSRLDPLQAAFLAVKLGKLDEWNDRRRTIAGIYSRGLASLPLVCPGVLADTEPVWHLYVIRSQQRDALARHLADSGIQTGLHYPLPCFEQPAYRDMAETADRFPLARQIAAEVLSLPIGPHMAPKDAAFVVDSVRAFFGQAS